MNTVQAARPLALVTGASRGIGAATARALAPDHDVLLGGREEQALAALAAQLPGARPWPVELTDMAALAAAVADIDRLDVLVHCAGVCPVASIPETSVDVWRRTMDVNVVAVAELTRLLLPALRAARGRVVLVNSGSGLRATADWSAYSASKFALRAFADSLREEEAGNGVRVTSVFPGRTDTEMQREVRVAEGGEYQPERYLQATSVADAIRFAITSPPDALLQDMLVQPTG